MEPSMARILACSWEVGEPARKKTSCLGVLASSEVPK